MFIFLKYITYFREILRKYHLILGLSMSRISCNITILLMRIFRPLEYIKIQDHEVEENLKGNAAAVLMLYNPRFAQIQPIKICFSTYKRDFSVSWNSAKE